MNVSNSVNLGKYYKERDTATKQRIVSSIFPSNLVFDKNIVRTLEINKALALLCSNNKPSRGRKKEKHTQFGVPSLRVEPADIFSNSFIQDLHRLISLNSHLKEKLD
jgi:hypothetical protein